MAYLVTGGAGFIGSHLVERLLEKGVEVVCLDNFDKSYDPSVKRQNIKLACENPSFSLLEADIRQSFLLEGLFSKFEIDSVIHLASRAGVRDSLKDPVGYAEVNLSGTINLLECCRKFGVKNLIFGSSSSVYGEGAGLPFSEADTGGAPLSPYAATKLGAEALCQTYHRLYGLNITCLRFFTVYGPRQRPNMAIRIFAESMLTGEEISIFGDGTSKRDYTYIDDIVEGITSTLEKKLPFEIINLGNNRPIPILEVVSTLEREIGLKPKIKYLPPQPGDVETTWADLTKAARLLGYRPKVGFEAGIARFVKWFKEQEGFPSSEAMAKEGKLSI